MRYIIGIDLGTTNSALAYVDTEHPQLPIHVFQIPQLTSIGKVDSLSTLPSFCYLVLSEEWTSGALRLPWKEETSFFVGRFAKIQGAQVPTRLIHSAKSWLSNSAAKRKEKILPLEIADTSLRLSPVEVSAKYLSHLRDAWNAQIAKANPLLVLEEQEVILTVPASFDEVARGLTLEAAKLAGFLHVTLIEEPQAAFYSWISQNERDWQTHFRAGECILVCDVGGGTTDFSLIEIQEKDGILSFQRMAVGDHLLLGGDNIDIALTHYLENKINQNQPIHLNSTQWLQLQAAARDAKESLLADDVKSEDIYSILIQGIGSSVVKGSITTTISRSEIETLLTQGFFGQFSLIEALDLKLRRGIKTMGLPYEDEPSITKHLAHFLKQSHLLDNEQGIDYILFNGGTLKPEIFQKAIEHSLNEWFPQKKVKKLNPFSLDLAVARGAAYYGKTKRGHGVRIGGGIARTYYLKVQVKNESGVLSEKALTLIPKGSLEEYVYQPQEIFSLRANTPVLFHLLTSHVRLHDQPGVLVDIDVNEMYELPAIQTVLRFGKQLNSDEKTFVPVKLGIRYTEIGTVDLWLDSVNTTHRWNLEFQLRSATGQETLQYQKKSRVDETYEKGYLDACKLLLENFFSLELDLKPSQVIEKLETELHLSKANWGLNILRQLSDTLLKVSSNRKKTIAHEARWWNLIGFFLRPGFGVALDDFKIKELWKIILSDLKNVKSEEVLVQMLICFRRISGGLNKGQQMQVASEFLQEVLNKNKEKNNQKQKNNLYYESEKIRTLSSLERLDISIKTRLGDFLLNKIINHKASKVDFWSFERIGARHLLYGSIAQVIPKNTCQQWIEKLLNHNFDSTFNSSLVELFIHFARKTDHREINVDEVIIQKIIQRFPHESLKTHLLDYNPLTMTEQEELFGESLPLGLVIENIKS